MLGDRPRRCHAARVDESRVRSASALRAAGFFLTVLGVLLVGFGVVGPWVQLGLDGTVAEAVTPTYVGADLLEGKLALAFAVAALVGVLMARMGMANSRRGAALVVLAAGLATLAVSGSASLTAPDRLERQSLDQLRETGGDGAGDLVAVIARAIEPRLGSGIWLSLAGGLSIAVGGTVTQVWARRTTPQTDTNHTLSITREGGGS